MIKIRKARIEDFKELYKIGLETPELRVSSAEPFMDKDDLRLRIKDKKHIFLIAEEKRRILGFIVANIQDIDRPLKNKYACLVYIVVIPKYRHKGIATKLYDECVKRLKLSNITHIYALADANATAIHKFLLKKSFRFGEKLIWVDKKL